MALPQKITLKNFIGGELTEIGKSASFLSPCGELEAFISSATPGQLRMCKRRLPQVQGGLSQLTLRELADVVREMAEHYFTDPEKLRILGILTGSPLSFLEESLARRTAWAKRIAEFVKAALPGDDGLPYRRIWESRGPVVAILPRNSDEESFYVLVQALLSRSPVLMKCANSGCSSFSALEFMRALATVAEGRKDLRFSVLRHFASVFNLFPHEEVFERIYVAGATSIVFGSSSTVALAAKSLVRGAADRCLGFGSGLAVAIVLESADFETAAEEIFDGFTCNNGAECISTSVVYVHEEIYEELTRAMNARRARAIADSSGGRGKIPAERLRSIVEALRPFGVTPGDVGTSDAPNPVIVEITGQAAPLDLPAPVVFLQKVSSLEEAIISLRLDLKRASQSASICCSVFAQEVLPDITLLQIPAHTIKLNEGTHRMNVFAEHQGVSLLRELVSPKVLPQRPMMPLRLAAGEE